MRWWCSVSISCIYVFATTDYWALSPFLRMCASGPIAAAINIDSGSSADAHFNLTWFGVQLSLPAYSHNVILLFLTFICPALYRSLFIKSTQPTFCATRTAPQMPELLLNSQHMYRTDETSPDDGPHIFVFINFSLSFLFESFPWRMNCIRATSIHSERKVSKSNRRINGPKREKRNFLFDWKFNTKFLPHSPGTNETFRCALDNGQVSGKRESFQVGWKLEAMVRCHQDFCRFYYSRGKIFTTDLAVVLWCCHKLSIFKIFSVLIQLLENFLGCLGR